MKIRIDLKIFIFLALFYFTMQLKIYLIIMFFCLLHELGHAIMGLILKMKPERLEIIPTGIRIRFETNIDDLNTKIKKGNLLELKKIFVALAGPIVTLILTIIFTYLEHKNIIPEKVVYSNIVILLFNLLPLYPLDGGQIIKSILHIEYGNKESQIIINKISNITMILLTIASSIAIYYFKNISIFFICVFLWIITIEENRQFQTNIRMYNIVDNI